MPLALLLAGIAVHGTGYFWLVVLAYREAPAAGRVALFVWPLGMLLPLIRRDEGVLKPFALAVAGLAMIWGGSALMPDDAPPSGDPAGFALPR